MACAASADALPSCGPDPNTSDAGAAAAAQRVAQCNLDRGGTRGRASDFIPDDLRGGAAAARQGGYAEADKKLSPSRVQEERLASQAVGRTLPYLVYLPPGYDADLERRYPVLYMLHGLGGSYG